MPAREIVAVLLQLPGLLVPLCVVCVGRSRARLSCQTRSVVPLATVHPHLVTSGRGGGCWQEDLTALPSVAITPGQLAPVVLFEGSFQTSATQTVTLTNSGNTTVQFNVRLCADRSSLHTRLC